MSSKDGLSAVSCGSYLDQGLFISRSLGCRYYSLSGIAYYGELGVPRGRTVLATSYYGTPRRTTQAYRMRELPTTVRLGVSRRRTVLANFLLRYA